MPAIFQNKHKLRLKMGKFKKNYLGGNHIFAQGHNRRRIKDIYHDTYCVIDVVIKEQYGQEILRDWNIHTCDTVYECERCGKGGLIIEDLIYSAEVNNRELKDKSMCCKECLNFWDVDVRLVLKKSASAASS